METRLSLRRTIWILFVQTSTTTKLLNDRCWLKLKTIVSTFRLCWRGIVWALHKAVAPQKSIRYQNLRRIRWWAVWTLSSYLSNRILGTPPKACLRKSLFVMRRNQNTLVVVMLRRGIPPRLLAICPCLVTQVNSKTHQESLIWFTTLLMMMIWICWNCRRR